MVNGDKKTINLVDFMQKYGYSGIRINIYLSFVTAQQFAHHHEWIDIDWRVSEPPQASKQTQNPNLTYFALKITSTHSIHLHTSFLRVSYEPAINLHFILIDLMCQAAV